MKTPYWFSKVTLWAIFLLPFAFIYSFVSLVVFHIRARNVYVSRRPVVCFGNILAGGVGKTPIVRRVAEFLDAPIVMRGYKRTKHTNNIGDEALMLSRYGLAVHTGDRKSNIMLLDKQTDDTPIIMDDGFQNPTIKKTISILVFDENIGVGNGFLLPAGPLREGMGALKRADAVIIIRGTAGRKKEIKIPSNIPVFYADSQTISPYDENEKLYAFAGIGYPKKFFGVLKNVVGTRIFADHYQYTDDDINKLSNIADKMGAKLITTEKDWVRLSDIARSRIKYAKQEITIEGAFWDWLKGAIDGKIIKEN